MYQKVIISKQINEPTKIHYEVGKEIENGEYEDLLNHFTPNFEFSLVDRFIQEFSSDMVPSFKKSSAFTNEDFENIVRSFKNKYKVKKKPKKKKKQVSYFKPKSKRVPPRNKRAKKSKKDNNKTKNSKIRKTQKTKNQKHPKKKGNNKK